MHKDTEYVVVPFEQKVARPTLRERKDLTESDIDADMAIKVADRFFRFDFAKVKFSGVARYCDDHPEGDSGETPFDVEIWEGEELRRQARFWNTGVTGILYALVDGPVGGAMRQDIIGAFTKTLNETRGMAWDAPREYTCEVDDWSVTFNSCFFP